MSKKHRIALIALMIAAILVLHYSTLGNRLHHHAVYRALFYLPLVLGSLWFGLKGSAYITTAIFIFYLPHGVQQWEGAPHDFNTLLEAGLFVTIALVIGFLTERQKKDQAARIEAEGLAAIGRAVSEIAHDIKSPLMAVGGFVNQVSKALPPGDPNQKKLGIVLRETSRLEGMVREMLDFGKPIELQRTRADLNDLVLDAVEVSRPAADQEGVELAAVPETSLPSVPLDVSRMKQVLLNLIGNAIQASPPGEQVVVRTRFEKNRAILEVSDSGCGISEEDQENVFRPFFSTKKGGTGLGLVIVKKIVDAHRGEIFFRPNPGKGSIFTVHLPLNATLEIS